jgi:hypothetical protein
METGEQDAIGAAIWRWSVKVGDLVEWTVDGDIGIVTGIHENCFRVSWSVPSCGGEWYRYDHPSIIKINWDKHLTIDLTWLNYIYERKEPLNKSGENMHLQKFELGETVIIPEQGKSWPPHPAAVGVVVSNSYEEWARQKVIRIKWNDEDIIMAYRWTELRDILDTTPEWHPGMR